MEWIAMAAGIPARLMDSQATPAATVDCQAAPATACFMVCTHKNGGVWCMVRWRGVWGAWCDVCMREPQVFCHNVWITEEHPWQSKCPRPHTWICCPLEGWTH
eukprot:scaffold247856_cov22-Tisochrysis_lutea.AAC.2